MNLTLSPDAAEHLAHDLDGRILRIAFTTGCGGSGYRLSYADSPIDGDRVTQVLWQRYGGTAADLEKLQYGYDRASNRTFKDDVLTSDRDEYYQYDGLNRLLDMARGQLNIR